jgi:hypothetical protein
MEERGGIFEWLKEEKESPTTLLSKVLVYQKKQLSTINEKARFTGYFTRNQLSPHVTGVPKVYTVQAAISEFS